MQVKQSELRHMQEKKESNAQKDLQALREFQKAEMTLSQLRHEAEVSTSNEFELKAQLKRKGNNL